jgi:hypothetical protein
MGRLLRLLPRRRPLLEGLLAMWELEEASGTRFDAHGGQHLTAVNNLGNAAGVVGQAAAFAAASEQYLERATADATAFNPGTRDFTLAAWVRFSDVDQLRTIIAKGASGNTADDSPGYWLYRTAGNQIHCAIGGGGTSTRVISSNATAIAADTWYFITVTVTRADFARVYVNAAVTGVTSITGHEGSMEPAVAFRLARRATTSTGGGVQFMDGRMDQAGIWMRRLSDAEVTWLYNGGVGRSYAELRSYRG